MFSAQKHRRNGIRIEVSIINLRIRCQRHAKCLIIDPQLGKLRIWAENREREMHLRPLFSVAASPEEQPIAAVEDLFLEVPLSPSWLANPPLIYKKKEVFWWHIDLFPMSSEDVSHHSGKEASLARGKRQTQECKRSWNLTTAYTTLESINRSQSVSHTALLNQSLNCQNFPPMLLLLQTLSFLCSR